MRKIIIIPGLFMLLIFIYFLFFSSADNRTPSTKMGHRISREVGEMLKIRYGVHFSGISEAGSIDKYKIIGLYLNTNTILTKDQGRILLLNSLRDTLEIFNSCSEFEPYMENYPFTGDNIFIVILVQPPGVSEIYYPNITSFSICRGRLTYSAKTTEVPYLHAHEEEETYEEALKIIEAQNRSSH